MLELVTNKDLVSRFSCRECQQNKIKASASTTKNIGNISIKKNILDSFSINSRVKAQKVSNYTA